jgi:microcystin-dependent protein
MSFTLAPYFYQQFSDSNGAPLAGGRVYSYQAGTSTPQATYTDSSGGTPNANPIILDASGSASVWLDPTLSYKFILKDSSDNVIKTIDGIVGLLTNDSVATASLQDGAVTTPKLAAGAVTGPKLASDASVDGNRPVDTNNIKDSAITLAKIAAAAQASLLLPSGAVVPYVGTAAPSGYLLCNGQPVSRSTYSALYAVIGNKYGQGDSSTTFNVPDLRGMFVRGATGWTDVTFTTTDVSTGTDLITVSGGHGLNRSGFPVRLTTTGGLPAPLAVGTTYYAIYVSSTTFKLASSEANAIAGTAIDLTTTGSGTQTLTQYADPDSGSRSAIAPGGSTGITVGSKQGGATAKNGLAATDSGHTHRLTHSDGTDGAGGSNGNFVAPINGTGNRPGVANFAYYDGSIGSSTANISITGDSETRPQNLYLNYIIKT